MPYNDAVTAINIPELKLFARGKVREVFDLGNEYLIITSDRISAYDSIMQNGIPQKGVFLNQIAAYWLRYLKPFGENHYISSNDEYIFSCISELGVSITPDLKQMLKGRSVIALKAEIFPVECVVRGYISGSLWKEYVDAGGQDGDVIIHDVRLPGGLKESDKLPEPIFTPATKATSGHDENISFEEMAEIVGSDSAAKLRSKSIQYYNIAVQRAISKGLILADTKFEFGIHDGRIILCDEALTPDSSRYWDASQYSPGGPQPSYDKQFVRDFLVSSGWNREPPAPFLPEDVVSETRSKYAEAYHSITGIKD